MLRLLALLLTLAGAAHAQTTVRQSGNITPGHAVRWISPGVIGDAGTASAGSLSSLGVTNSGPGICQNSGVTSAAYNRICLTATATAAGITIDNIGGATGSFTLTVNGVAQGFATVVLPVTTNDAACWANTSGGLKDCGTPTVTSLSGNTIFYVNSSTGNDANVCTIASTCATIQRAMNVIATLFNLGGFNATINVTCASPPCTYATAVNVPVWTGQGTVTLLGDATTPTNVVVSGAISVGVGSAAGSPQRGTALSLSGLKLTATTALSIFDGSKAAIVGNMNFGGGGNQINLARHGDLRIASSYTVSAGGVAHIALTQNSVANNGTGTYVVTLSGTPAWSGGFITLNLASTLNFGGGISFTGGGTGTRYTCANNSVLNLSATANTVLANVGNANGSPATGCQAP